ncbi:MAG: hypothetical protein ABJN26_00570 [Stappiaceae bacterium]
MIRSLSLALALFALVSQASAETKSLDVKAGRATGVDYFAIYGEFNCKGAQLPKLKIKKQPSNGKIRFEKYTHTFAKDSGKCAGAKIPGMVVVYTPNSGYRGNDTFTVGYSYNRYIGSGRMRQKSFRYKLKVN